MGRFDVLTQLDNEPTPSTPLLENEVPVKSTTKSVNRFASKPAKKQASKEASQQTNISVSSQISKEAKKQTTLLVNRQTPKLLKKFGSYLTQDSLRRLKRIAFETDRKDYEVLQEAVDQYLEQERATK